ncbi:keratinocyte differentiation-associated protein isoform X2 [Equus quagga]|uniref:Keratinocyte differentiation-associated protein isoform X2 n=1 Tax=Equus przewalskii TaxID=9798 RepID=A0ABM2F8H8_EQUPR|nr:PREDICTED: keratinocyte differentiation-associated protein isoform X2 [Equus przewalskii]XP_014589135.1 keratinocyte differentiation-associated protein isoform X2 [Equus caballus]XP_046537295.1 keratinocyte differentiation-associated protein isoform X2 [Equus quagga]
MKIPVLPAVALLSLLAFHSAQGASLSGSEEETTLGNYAAGPEAFKTDEFLNWHALFESIKKKLPFLNWDAFPKLKGLRSATPDAQ